MRVSPGPPFQTGDYFLRSQPGSPSHVLLDVCCLPDYNAFMNNLFDCRVVCQQTSTTKDERRVRFRTERRRLSGKGHEAEAICELSDDRSPCEANASIARERPPGAH